MIPKLYPALNAETFAFATGSSAPNLPLTQSMTGSIGRLNIHEIRPSAKKFFDRRTPRPLRPLSLTASLVSCSMGTVSRW